MVHHQNWQAGEVVVGISHTMGQSLPDVPPEAHGERHAIIGEWDEGLTEPDEQVTESYPSCYGYGEFVVDRLMGVARCEVASIAWTSGAVPPPSLVRSRFGIAPHLSVEITNKPPRRVCTLDEVIWLDNGELYDIGRCDMYEPQDLALKLTTYELTAEDILRLRRLIKGYPEIVAPTLLVEFLAAGVGHLDSLRSRFPEVEALFTQYTTISRWRAGDNQPRP